MTFIKSCVNCGYELDLDSMDITFKDQIQCPECYNTVSIPEEYYDPLTILENIEA